MEPPSITHASDETLEQYAMNSLAGTVLDQFEEHLLVCAACQDRLAETDVYLGAMRAAAARVRREPARAAAAPWGRPLLGLAFAAGLVLFLAVWLQPRGQVPAVAVLLQANRGAMAAHSQAPADKPLTLQMDLADLDALPAFRVEIVDEAGRRLWQGAASPRDGRAAVHVSRALPRGRHYVRLYSPASELLREYGLEIY